jgi:SagB-type dehydrogenase family enzyme
MADPIVRLPALPGPVPAIPEHPEEGAEAALGRLLGALASRPGGLPKYRYPSAGTLYPVQAYIVLRRGIGALAQGSYYYDPEAHALVVLSAATPPAPDGTEPSILLFLVAQTTAIAPIYGSEAEAFCLLEAGYMAEALRERGAGLELREAGDPAGNDPAALAVALRLDPTHRPLVCWAVEAIE